MRVLVTGGTGFLGSAIVRALSSRGHEPVVFARSASAAGVASVRGDIRNLDDLQKAAAGCDAVIHSAALVSVGRPRRADFDEINVGGLQHVLALATDGRIRRIVYTSSFLALPPAGLDEPLRLNDYQRTKVIADAVARSSASGGAPIVTVYPGVIYGVGPMTDGNLVGRSLADHLAGRLPGVIGANRTWSFSFVDDVAAGHVAALESGRLGARYKLGGENLPQMRPFELLRERTGRPLPRRIPFVLAAAVGLADQARARLTGAAPILTVGTARILTYDWPLDSSDAARDLGYRPRPLAEGLAAVLQALGAANSPGTL
jgi:farnesol dehydrogenase